MPEKNEDLLILLAAGIIAGSASILILFAGDVNYFTVALYRLVIATFAVALIGLPARRIKIPAPSDRLLIVGSGIFLGLHFIAFTYAVQFTSVSNATFLGDLGPVFVALMSPVFLKERITRREIGFVGLAVIGSLLAGSRGGSSILLPSLSPADLTAIFAAFLAASYTVLGRRLRLRVGWFTYIAYVYLVASLLVAAVAFSLFGLRGLLAPLAALPALLALGLLPTFGGHSLYNLALGRVKAIRANLFLLLEPIIASVLAYLLFSQSPTYLQSTGYALIAVSILGVGLELSRPLRYATSK